MPGDQRFDPATTLELLPYPVAAIVRRLGTEVCLEPGWDRLHSILDAGEAISRFVGIVVACEVRDQLERQRTPLPAPLMEGLVKVVKQPAWGDWLFVARHGLVWLREQNAPLVWSRVYDFYSEPSGELSAAANALSELLQTRNRVGHGREAVIKFKKEFRPLCERLFPLLSVAVAHLVTTMDCELREISQITVSKRRNRDASFQHRFVRMRGSDSDFYGWSDARQSFWETNEIILVGTGAYLSLYPFLISDDESGRAKDVFYMNSASKTGRSITYTGCKQGGTFVTSKTNISPALRDSTGHEVQHLLTLFEQGGEVLDE